MYIFVLQINVMEEFKLQQLKSICVPFPYVAEKTSGVEIDYYCTLQ